MKHMALGLVGLLLAVGVFVRADAAPANAQSAPPCSYVSYISMSQYGSATSCSMWLVLAVRSELMRYDPYFPDFYTVASSYASTSGRYV